jgi:hypothetical protein
MGDHHHVSIYNSHMSCGALELTNMRSEPERVLYALCTYLYHPSRGAPAAFALWSDTKESDGVKFAKYLAELDMVAYYTHWTENPKTSNEIAIWTWVIPHERLKKWYLTERVKKAQKL